MAENGFAPSGGARIYYESAGSGGAVVFVHAGIADSRMWDPQFTSVPYGYRYVRLDLQGFGKSEFTGQEFSNHEDVIAVMDHLSVDRAVLVGCSIGGDVALEMAQAVPDRVSSMVLIGAEAPGFEPPGDYESPQWPEAVAAFKAGDLQRVAELDAEMWAVGYGRSAEEADPAVIDLVVEMDRIPLASETEREEARIKPQRPDIAGFDLLALVVVGEHDLPDMRAHSEHLAEVLTGRPPLVVAGAAHLACLEQPGTFNDALAGFLATC